MVSKSNIGSGDVEVRLSGEKVVLRPSLNAAIKLSTMPGGLTKLVTRCSNLDFEAISDVLIIGGEMKVDEKTKEKIYRAGLMDLTVPCIEYLNILANGGNRPSLEEKDDEAPLGRNSR
jgi:hypothetical protein